MNTQKLRRRRTDHAGTSTTNATRVAIIVTMVTSACLVRLASATSELVAAQLADDQMEWNSTTTDNKELLVTTSIEEVASDTTVVDVDVTTQTDIAARYDDVTSSPSSYDDEATEAPTTMTTESDVDRLSSGWEDHRSGGSDGHQNDADELVEDREMIHEFYKRYNSTTSEVDLVFVLDRSGSVPIQGWQAIIEFVKNVIEHFTVDRHNTRVAVVTFSTTATIDINDLEPGPVTDFETKCTLYGRLDRHVARRRPYGYTATHEALQRATQVLLDSRPSAKKAVIVITDGKSNIGPPPVRVAVDLLRLRWSSFGANADWNEQLYGPQVEIYAFGVADANPAELRSIASNLPGHLFTMATFKLFEQFAKSIHGDKQEIHWIPTIVDECPDTCTGNHVHCMCGSKVGAYACVCDPGYHLINSECLPCEIGYFKATLSPALCTQCPENTTTSQEASTSREQCKPLPGHVRCPPLPLVEHGRSFYVEGDTDDEVADTGIECDRVTDGNSCHYVSETGYRLTGPPVLKCNYSGHWDGDVPQCQVVDCHPIDGHYQSLVGATVQYLNESSTYGSSVMATCRRGTIGVGRTIWDCDHNGLWTYPADFQCHAVFCQALPLVAQLETMTEECREQNVPYGEVCQLRCAGTGFQLIGPSEYTCTFDVMTMVWTPDNWPTCKDVQPPKIICPNDIDVTVAEPGDNSTIVHYDVQKPQAVDNSGLVYYRVLGVPNLINHAFPIGYTKLTYEAHDETGNKAFCHQYVHVRARTVEVFDCPENITATVTSLRRSTFVEWNSPTFIGADGHVLHHECSVKSGAEFGIGSNHVICYAPEYPRVSCQFYVNVIFCPKSGRCCYQKYFRNKHEYKLDYYLTTQTWREINLSRTDPPCPIPYEDDPPVNGALICGVMGHHYPRACRIHCREGYELRRYEASHKFVCQWDGTWTIDGPWPNCFMSRRPTKAITENQLYVRYQGSCTDARGSIAEAFVHTMSRILDDEHGPCPPGFLCNVEEVRVLCGTPPLPANLRAPAQSATPAPRRRRRNIKDDGETGDHGEHTAIVMLVTSAQLLNSSNGTATAAGDGDRNRVMTALDGLSEAVWRQIIDVGIGDGSGHVIDASTGAARYPSSAEETLEQLMVTEMQEVSRQWEAIKCGDGEVLENDGTSTVCYSCPPGSHRSKEQCEVCAIGTYQNKDGSAGCNQCPTGTTTIRTGSKTIEDCRSPCQPGYLSLSGLEPCAPCALGTFQNTSGSTDCFVCPSGAPFTSKSLPATSVTHCYDYVDCDAYNVTCDVIAGFRCTLYAQNYDNAVRSGNVTMVRCVCEADDGCPPVTMATRDTDIISTTAENTTDFADEKVAEDGDDNDDFSYNEWMLPPDDRLFENSEDDDDFDLIFSQPSTAMQWILKLSFNEFTACMWLRPTPVQRSPVAVLSLYKRVSPPGSSPIVSGRGVKIAVDFSGHRESPAVFADTDDQSRVVVVLKQEAWNHLCASWTRLTGYWRFHVNGISSSASSALELYSPLVGDYLRRGSRVILGEQFVGEFSQFHVYDRVINDKDASIIASTRNMKFASSRCRVVKEVAGNVLSWRRIMPIVTSSSHVVGYVKARNRSRCLIPWEGDEFAVLDDACSPSAFNGGLCLNGGNCRLDLSTAQFFCDCPSGYIGSKCQLRFSVVSSGFEDPCVRSPCLNGGICVSDRSTAICRCTESWTGKHCQVSRAPTSCTMNPCVNNGTCIDVISDSYEGLPSYRCICPPQQESVVVVGGLDLTASIVVGANCEHLSVCDSMPCGKHGTCVTLISTDRESGTRGGGSAGYRCICDAGFQGPDCTMPSNLAAQPTAVKHSGLSRDHHVMNDFCSAVDCQNGGTCQSNEHGFSCNCPRDYTGKYCSVLRHTDTKRYRVTVTLRINDTIDVYYDSTFQESFRLQIHDLFGELMGDNKLYILIDDIRVKREAISVDFILIFTRYIDTTMFTNYDVTGVFERNLAINRIGKFAATRDGFSMEEIRVENEAHVRSQGSIDVIRDVMLCVLAGVATFFLVIVLTLRECRRHGETRPISAFISRQNDGQAPAENNYVFGGDRSRASFKQNSDDITANTQCQTKDNVVIEGLDIFPKVDNVEHKCSSKREDVNVYREMDQHHKRKENFDQLISSNGASSPQEEGNLRPTSRSQ